MQIKEITPHITSIRVPFLDIFTTVFLVRTEKGNLLFDTATYPTDITELILPALDGLGIGAADISHVLISHPHRDHMGGLEALLAHCPDITVAAGSQAPLSGHTVRHFLLVGDGDILLDRLRVVAIPGHTADAVAILDTRTGTLLSGDGLQLYGIFGSGWWGANISRPTDHLAALERIAALPLSAIYPAHDYHPLGDAYLGREAILGALDACREPLFLIRDMILASPDKDDKALAADYRKQPLPIVGPHVFAAVRRELL